MRDIDWLQRQYVSKVKALTKPTFQDIRAIAVEALKGFGDPGQGFSEKERDALWEELDRGKTQIDKPELLWRYLYAYGNMHERKMKRALEACSDVCTLEGSVHVIDWGCGQGLASVCLLDYLQDHEASIDIERVTLIEPSQLALDYAELHVGMYGTAPTATVNKALDEVNDQDVASEADITLHLLSNILDVEGIDLKHLAQVSAGSAEGIHYFICVSPLYANNNRIDTFGSYFLKTDVLSRESIFNGQTEQLAYETKESSGAGDYTMELLVFKYTTGISSVVKIDYYLPAQFIAGYELDFIRERRKTSAKATSAETVNMPVCNAAAPFDLAAYIYDDVHPLLAVLSNIIGRGRPTLCSPFIEEQFTFAGNARRPDDLGGIAYHCDDISPDRATRDAQFYTPIGVAWIQKVIVEALICGKLSLDTPTWEVLVREYDVPCAALAFADLEQMMSHLAALTQDYPDMHLPTVHLHIITSEKWLDSHLHLDAEVATEPTEHLHKTTYDLVIEIGVKAPFDEVRHDFSDFRAKNDCYFAIGHATKPRATRRLYTSDAVTYRPLGNTAASGAFEPDPEATDHVRYFLNLLFRKQDFRPGQVPILNRALQRQNLIGLLPTGGGKSLTYQLAALLQPGITLIIDPLKSLMKDQYDGLLSHGIDACSYINSSISQAEKQQRERQMADAQLQFVFISPERLCISAFRQQLHIMHAMRVYFSYGVIDEAHCVSEWGHDFRFSYLHLGRNLHTYAQGKHDAITLFGLTATASFDVLADVERELSGEGAYPLDANTVVRYENADRLELQYKITRVADPFPSSKYGDLDSGMPRPCDTKSFGAYDAKQSVLEDCLREMPQLIEDMQKDRSLSLMKARFAERQNGEVETDTASLVSELPPDLFAKSDHYEQAGIVFCPHKDKTGIAVRPTEHALSRFIPDVGVFMGGEESGGSQQERSYFKNLDRFKQDESPLMVATKAFGMGIDKPNIRFTVHLNYPGSLESFVQEAGRAGRDRKIAIANVLVSDYRLEMIDPAFEGPYPTLKIRGKWFYADDLHTILNRYHLEVPDEAIHTATPETDWVKIKNPDQQPSDIPADARGWHLADDLESTLYRHGITLPSTEFEHLDPDYSCNWFFHSTNFKSQMSEKRILHDAFCQATIGVADGTTQLMPTRDAVNLIDTVLSLAPGESLTAFIPYTEDKEGDYADLQKAIYRMCCIGFICDFTQNYREKQFRIVMTRKPDGDYYDALKTYLMRYYSEAKATELSRSAASYRGQNEVQKCLGFLTDFVYSKIVTKRKRAIDDMRAFCLQGLRSSRDWQETNEDLKDFIYYYFNSKYANERYETENGEPYSLTSDTDHGKISTPDIVLKYLRVVDDDMIGTSGTPLDNAKHLQGAVRLIRRSLADPNPSLQLLNVFCLAQLGTNGNEALERELANDYRDGLAGFAEQMANPREYWAFESRFHEELDHRPSTLQPETLQHMRTEARAYVHLAKLRKLNDGYLSGLTTRRHDE